MRRACDSRRRPRLAYLGGQRPRLAHPGEKRPRLAHLGEQRPRRWLGRRHGRGNRRRVQSTQGRSLP